MLSVIFKVTKYTLAGFIVLLFILIASNWQDGDFLPVPEYFEHHDHVDKPDNAYFAIVGFNAAASENMHVMGYQIIRAFESTVADKSDGAFNPDTVKNASGIEFKGNTDFLCKPLKDVQCLKKITDNKVAILQLQNMNQVLYQRYKALNGYSKFHEDSAYLPTWSGIFSVHYLYLNMIGIEWRAGNKDKAISMLAETIRFNYLLLTESELLINNLTGLALLKNSLAFYSQLYKECSDCDGLRRLSRKLQQLTRNQICMKKPVIGELKYLKRQFEKMPLHGDGYNEYRDDPFFVKIWNKYFGLPATNFNYIYRTYERFFALCDLPIHELKTKIDSSRKKSVFTFPWYSYIRNPLGKYELEYGKNGPGNFETYIINTIDFEGYLRLIRIQDGIYRNKVARNNIQDYLKTLPENLRDPYNNSPMRYDNKAHAIYFDSNAKRNDSQSQRIEITL